jgi:FixJ family two-component response regulator
MLERSHPSIRAERSPSSRLVLIEDDENVRRSMTMLLRARGFIIDAYRSGTEFLTLQGRHGGDCLLIDYKMPRLDGLEVMRRVRAVNDTTPAIMITGYYSDSLLARARSAGFAEVLEKPATPEALIRMISDTIN